MDPKDILGAADTLKMIDGLCKEHCLDENEADECFLYVLDVMEKDNYRRLLQYGGRCKLSTFLHTVTINAIVDFKRKRYGRNRLPVGVQKLGDWAERLYGLICWFNYELREAYDILHIQGLYKGTFVEFLGDAEKVREATCRKNPRWHSLEKAQEAGFDPASPEENPLEAYLGCQDLKMLQQARPVLLEVVAKMSQNDQMLLMMVYGEDHSVNSVARHVGMKPSEAKKRLAEIMLELKAALIAAGIRGLD